MHLSVRSGLLLVAAALVPAALVGCGQESVSNAAPPTVVCGTTLSNSAAGAVVVDATRNHKVITAPTGGGWLFVRVSADCSHGPRVTWTPAAGTKLVKEARAKDGLDAAVVVLPTTGAAFTLSAKRNGAVVGYTTVRLGH